MRKCFILAVSIMLCMILTQSAVAYAAPAEDVAVMPESGDHPTKPEPILDDNGVPLGEWRWDGDRGEWIFEELSPLTDMPWTGALRWPLPVLLLIGMQLLFFGWLMTREVKH